jgi:hypothetical protein
VQRHREGRTKNTEQKGIVRRGHSWLKDNCITETEDYSHGGVDIVESVADRLTIDIARYWWNISLPCKKASVHARRQLITWSRMARAAPRVDPPRSWRGVNIARDHGDVCRWTRFIRLDKYKVCPVTLSLLPISPLFLSLHIVSRGTLI